MIEVQTFLAADIFLKERRGSTHTHTEVIVTAGRVEILTKDIQTDTTAKKKKDGRPTYQRWRLISFFKSFFFFPNKRRSESNTDKNFSKWI